MIDEAYKNDRKKDDHNIRCGNQFKVYYLQITTQEEWVERMGYKI